MNASLSSGEGLPLQGASLPCVEILPGFFCRHEQRNDAPAILALHEETFGPGRFARTAFRLREGVSPDLALSFVVLRQEKIVASVRLTPLFIGDVPALLLGPLAVSPAFKNQGLGKALMRRAMEEARGEGHRAVLLVGALSYYWPFGFRPVSVGRIVLPGPVDPARLLIAELMPGVAETLHGVARGR